jgi:hypothetical protein
LKIEPVEYGVGGTQPPLLTSVAHQKRSDHVIRRIDEPKSER